MIWFLCLRFFPKEGLLCAFGSAGAFSKKWWAWSGNLAESRRRSWRKKRPLKPRWPWVASFWIESCLQNQIEPMNYRLWGRWKQEPIISCGPWESGKINSQKYYVIRDIPLFLRIVEQRKSLYDWQDLWGSLFLGKPLDEASQELLTFLRGLTEEGQAPDLFFQNQGRHLFFLWPFLSRVWIYWWPCPIFNLTIKWIATRPYFFRICMLMLIYLPLQ